MKCFVVICDEPAKRFGTLTSGPRTMNVAYCAEHAESQLSLLRKAYGAPWAGSLMQLEFPDTKPEQHCTNSDCYLTFSHTAKYCGTPQHRRCGCPWCYPNE
jgi:hypothetical protein